MNQGILKRSKLIFNLCFFIAVTLLMQMGMYVLHLLFGWNLSFNLILLCNKVAHFFGLFFIEYMLNAVIFHTMFVLFIKAVKQVIQMRKVRKMITKLRDETTTADLQKAYGKDLTVLTTDQPIALTMGLFTPHIVLSTGLLSVLDENELEAVIYHEQSHVANKDPLKTFLLSTLASALWYIPFIKWSHKRFKVMREVLADQDAIVKNGTSAHIGSALLKMVKTGQTSLSCAHVSFADTSVNYRIQYILNPETKMPMQPPVILTLTSLYVFFILCALIFTALTAL